MELKNLFLKCLLSCCVCFNCTAVTVDADRLKKCTKEELVNFFPEKIVQRVLVENGLSEENAKKIANQLSLQDLTLIKAVEEKAYKMNSNALSDLSQREKAVEIYAQTVHELFVKTLKPYDITDDAQIQKMLDEIKIERSQLFIECLLEKSDD